MPANLGRPCREDASSGGTRLGGDDGSLGEEPLPSQDDLSFGALTGAEGDGKPGVQKDGVNRAHRRAEISDAAWREAKHLRGHRL